MLTAGPRRGARDSVYGEHAYGQAGGSRGRGAFGGTPSFKQHSLINVRWAPAQLWRCSVDKRTPFLSPRRTEVGILHGSASPSASLWVIHGVVTAKV